ncbi:unnamed protein product [Closterium sp. Naga37s-1]|nr:unnamed protein product [Closterium sp. Naga37s-1]
MGGMGYLEGGARGERGAGREAGVADGEIGALRAERASTAGTFSAGPTGTSRVNPIRAPTGAAVTAGVAGAPVEREVLNVKSFANNNQLAIMPDERVQVLEWNCRYLTVLAVANKRLYQLRLQVPERLLDSERPVLRQVMDSFRVFSVAE